MYEVFSYLCPPRTYFLGRLMREVMPQEVHCALDAREHPPAICSEIPWFTAHEWCKHCRPATWVRAREYIGSVLAASYIIAGDSISRVWNEPAHVLGPIPIGIAERLHRHPKLGLERAA